jgi:hypothetical protein
MANWPISGRTRTRDFTNKGSDNATTQSATKRLPGVMQAGHHIDQVLSVQ